MTQHTVPNAPKPLIALAELLAKQAAPSPTVTPTNPDDADSCSDEDDELPPAKRLRVHSPIPDDYIRPFAAGAVGDKYIVVKGIKPGIYDNWYVFCAPMFAVPR